MAEKFEYNERGERYAPNGRIWTPEMDAYHDDQYQYHLAQVRALTIDELEAAMVIVSGDRPVTRLMARRTEREGYLGTNYLLAGQRALADVNTRFGKRFRDENKLADTGQQG